MAKGPFALALRLEALVAPDPHRIHCYRDDETPVTYGHLQLFRELAKIDYKTLKRRADKLTRPDDASPGWNSEVVVLMAPPYRLSLVRARELAAAAAEIPALSHRRKDPISEAASAQGSDRRRNKSDFLRALSLIDFSDRIGYDAQNALILMTDYTYVAQTCCRAAPSFARPLSVATSCAPAPFRERVRRSHLSVSSTRLRCAFLRVAWCTRPSRAMRSGAAG